MTSADTPLKVLSVVGAGRSGTTVLASILGEVEGFASAGELRWLWERGVLQQRPCGCGKPPERCPVWSSVIARVMASSERWTVPEIVAAQHDVAHLRSLPRLLRASSDTQTQWPALDLVLTVTGRTVEAFAEGTNARVIVDTSKRPQDAAVSAMLEGVDHYVLHVVRDPRAVVHSWRRRKTFAAEGGTRTMGTRRLPSTVRAWTTNSIGSELLRRRVPASHWHHMRYEDFSRHPRSSVESIVAFLGEQGRTPFENEDTVALQPNHIVSGNPTRFTTGSVKIRADEEWRQAMPRRDQLLVQLATKPLMMRYGYTTRNREAASARRTD
ncbi:MAG: sulfotransferase [Nocardioidaceae bacterium]|nr:sulfotransferase [Nocardioidaceae bacterium]